ncbi:MAG: hypothetical protein QHJ34_12125 [bacterium]|jgi:hypothetical protein|nr:hypothetical protein [candidate division KSB1 bacterium]MDH7560959.1 hypothetical protein [bacterium]
MMVFDLNTLKAYPYKERDKNVFFRAPEFKARIIELPAGGEMQSYVVFLVIRGSAEAMVNQEETQLEAGQCLSTGPATLSLKSDGGVRILGLQVSKRI